MAELTDQEIVAACARAIGVQPHPMWNAAKWPTPDFFGTHGVFNPLTDRAQAMELQWWMISQGWCVSAEFDDRLEVYKTQRSVFSANRVDSEQAFRRAICLCAARVQIEKEKNA